MNPCLRFAPMIGARPGELPEADAHALAEHLAGCEACQARLADDAALSGLLPDALLAEAARRDFSAFSDEVLARIPAYAPRRARSGLLGWVGHHRWAAATSALVPALAAVGVFLYVHGGPAPGASAPVATVEVSAEGRSATVLDTDEGPVVLLGDEEPAGS